MPRDEPEPCSDSPFFQASTRTEGPPEWLRAAEAAYRSGNLDVAVDCLESPLEHDNQAIDLLISLADAFADRGRWNDATRLYRRALAARPRDAVAHHNLAAVLLQLNCLAEAIEHCRSALGSRPDYALALNTLGVALARSGRHAEAIEALEAVLIVKPNFAKAAFNLGQSLDDLGRRHEAMAAFRTALAIDPQLTAAAFDLAALGGCEPPSKMPPQYVLTLFDDYAPRFEQHLAGLKYSVPESLFAAISAARSARFVAAIDLGCGTGLVGAAFRPFVERLIGVDLSSVMIEASRSRGVYDELIQADVVDCLASHSGTVDLLLAADLLIYLGDLEPLFGAAADRLMAGGLFAFSIELTTDRDYALRSTRRYAHSAEYVRRLACQFRWKELASIEQTLRSQGDHGVDGQIFVFSRDAGAEFPAPALELD